MTQLRNSLSMRLKVEAELRGFSVEALPDRNGDLSWMIFVAAQPGGSIASNGEVYDLSIENSWHFYGFEYDESLEIVGSLLDVLSQYSKGRFHMRRPFLGSESMIIEAAGTEWEGRLEA